VKQSCPNCPHGAAGIALDFANINPVKRDRVYDVRRCFWNVRAAADSSLSALLTAPIANRARIVLPVIPSSGNAKPVAEIPEMPVPKVARRPPAEREAESKSLRLRRSRM
jgi:hypothetical protein